MYVYLKCLRFPYITQVVISDCQIINKIGNN